MVDAYELAINRLNTIAYIDSDSTDVAITPRVKVPDGAGGSTWSILDALPPQKIRVVTSSATGVTRRTVDGESATPDLLLILAWDALIEPGYMVPIDGINCEVIFVNNDLAYEKLAEVIRRG